MIFPLLRPKDTLVWKTKFTQQNEISRERESLSDLSKVVREDINC